MIVVSHVFGTHNGGVSVVMVVLWRRHCFGCRTDIGHVPKVGFLLGITTSSDTGALDLDSLNLGEQVCSIAEEVFVVVTTLVLATCQSGKVVEIELALEGGHLGEAKVTRKKFLEELWLVDGKASAVFLPGDNVCVAVGFDLFEHHEKLHGKACHEGILLCRVQDELFFLGGGLECMIVVVMLHNDKLITASTAFGGALRARRRGFRRSTRKGAKVKTKRWHGGNRCFGDAHDSSVGLGWSCQ